jgi:glycolate oxidase FAD binding subunit
MKSSAQILPLTETVAPADEAAVAALVQNACRRHTAVYPIGGGTSLDYGLRPTRPGIGLSSAGLNRLIDYPAADMTITVEAGFTIAELQRRLMAQRQWLPIDVAQPDKATVGGVVAANAYGPRRYAYGTVRDYLLGIRAVDGRGEAFAGGGRVVKNVAGYNIPRLLAGSQGRLGVITQVTFMVRPAPRASAIVFCDVADFEMAECLLAALGRSRTFPVAVELLAGRPRAGCPLPPPSVAGVARLLVGFDGNEAEVEWMVRQLSGEWRAVGATQITSVSGPTVEVIWRWIGESAANLQIDVLPSAVVRIVESLVEHDPDASIQAHAANGVLLVKTSLGNAKGRDFATAVRETLRPLAVAAGGNLVVLSSPPEATLDADDIWGPPGDGFAAMRAIQEQFDPEGIMNPGRFATE